jgi:hypothetical protein
LKQARAYGLGLVLATQNPVDLDYKGLSNTGTWFIGRLQTERDKARVMEGLEGASDADFNKQKMERTLAGLGKRRFLLHNVHEDEAVVFNTRWVLSYLAGPLTRDSIKSLMEKLKAKGAAVLRKATKPKRRSRASAPALPPAIEQFFVPGVADDLVYYPRLIAAADLVYNNARYSVEDERSCVYGVEFEDGPVSIDWDNSEPVGVSIDELDDQGVAEAAYADCPACAQTAKNYTVWSRDFKRWIRQNETVSIYRSKRFRLSSAPGEAQGDFRARLQIVANEKRDQAIAKIRKRYASKVTTLENRLLRAQQSIDRERQQATRKKLDTAVSFGTAILGAVLGRKRISSTSATRIGSAIKTASGARKEAADIKRAEQTAAKVKTDIEALNRELKKELATLSGSFDAQAEELGEIVVRAKTTDIHVPLLGLVWMPYQSDESGRLKPAWR